MSTRSLTLLSSLMSNIDEVKDKLSDGEYLTLCNLLKSLNDEIKNPSTEAVHDIEVEEPPYNDITRSLSDRIDDFLRNPDFYYRNGEEDRRLRRDQIYELFEDFLLSVYENEEENENTNRWFTCACRCTVAFRDIPEHLEDQRHDDNFLFQV